MLYKTLLFRILPVFRNSDYLAQSSSSPPRLEKKIFCRLPYNVAPHTSTRDLIRNLKYNMSAHPENKIDCSKVYVKKSSFSNEDTGDFDGAFAAVAIKEGEFRCFTHIHRSLAKDDFRLLALGDFTEIMSPTDLFIADDNLNEKMLVIERKSLHKGRLFYIQPLFTIFRVTQCTI